MEPRCGLRVGEKAQPRSKKAISVLPVLGECVCMCLSVYSPYLPIGTLLDLARYAVANPVRVLLDKGE